MVVKYSGIDFKTIPGFEGYFASACGLILSHRRNYYKLLNQKLSPQGYLSVTVFKETRPKTSMAHRLVYQAWKGAIPENYVIDHLDSDKTNNCISNLEAVTHSENTKRAYEKGHIALKFKKYRFQNEDHYFCKLSNMDVRRIRNLYATTKLTQQKLGEMFGVSQAHISRIILNQNRCV